MRLFVCNFKLISFSTYKWFRSDWISLVWLGLISIEFSSEPNENLRALLIALRLIRLKFSAHRHTQIMNHDWNHKATQQPRVMCLLLGNHKCLILNFFFAGETLSSNIKMRIYNVCLFVDFFFVQWNRFIALLNKQLLRHIIHIWFVWLNCVCVRVVSRLWCWIRINHTIPTIRFLANFLLIYLFRNRCILVSFYCEINFCRFVQSFEWPHAFIESL